MVSQSAISVSRSIRQGLGATPLPLRILAVFDNACNLVAADGRVFAVVNRSVGDGPLNIVVDDRLLRPLLPAAGAQAWIDANRLRLGQVEIGLECADWNPCPDWDDLRARYPTVRSRFPSLVQLARELAPPHSLMALWDAGQPSSPAISRVLGVFGQVVAALPPGEMWSPAQFELIGAQLAGLGWGLSPCGDDWLAGLLLWAWLAHPHPQEASAAIVRVAAPRTTLLSAAFLHSAAHGECDAAWQTLLATLASDPPVSLDTALRAVFAHGATSGADMLSGFLFPVGRFAA